MLLGAPFVGIFVSRVVSRGVTARRRLQATGTVGDVVYGDVSLHNNFRWPMFMVHLQIGEVVFRQGHEEVEAIVPVDREDLVAPVLRGRDTVTWRQGWRLQRRGVFQVSPARAGVLDPIGVYTRLPQKTAPHQITVLPRIVRVGQLSFLDSAAAGKQIPLNAAAVADATDFHGVRPWRPGEGLRRVHWKSTARTGQLHIVEWEEALASDTTVILDNQLAAVAGQGGDNSLETAITLAASIAAYLLENGYQFEMFYWGQAVAATKERHARERKAGGGTKVAPPHLEHLQARNNSELGRVLHTLAALPVVPADEATLPRLCAAATPRMTAGRSVLVIASSLADAATAMHHLQLAPSGAACQMLLLDGESFAENAGGSEPTPAGRVAASSRRIRVVRRGEPLAAVLERPW
jgi:hypothetical protein